MPHHIWGADLNNKLAIVPLTVTLLATLSACGADNEGPCTSFESAYNKADLDDKMLFKDDYFFTQSLQELGDVAEAASTEASGDVEFHTLNFAQHVDQYVETRLGTAEEARTIDRRVRLWEVRDDIVDSCEQSGHPIVLEEDDVP